MTFLLVTTLVPAPFPVTQAKCFTKKENSQNIYLFPDLSSKILIITVCYSHVFIRRKIKIMNRCEKEEVNVNNSIFSNEEYRVFGAYIFAGSHRHK